MRDLLRRCRRALPLAAALTLAAAVWGCDRNTESFDPDEVPRQPDLSKIFPEGAESAGPVPAVLPPAPGQPARRGAPALAREEAAGNELPPPIEGRVELAGELDARVPSGAVLFLIAHAHGGGPPLAVKRMANPRFPLEFRIGPEDRMVQARPFEGPISLSARLDTDGNAMSRSAGDLQGAAVAPVDPGAKGVVIRLDKVL